jgi:phosphatidylserine decarboxylase
MRSCRRSRRWTTRGITLPTKLKDSGLGHLRDAMALLESKAAAEERDDYRHFVLTLANKVAAAHREHGQDVSPAEAEAIQQITAALGMTGS